MVTPQPPSSPVPNTRSSSQYPRRSHTARMSTGGKPPPRTNTILRGSATVPSSQSLLDFPSKRRLAQEGRDTILRRLRILRRPLRSYQLGTAQKYLNSGIDEAYVLNSWIEHPDADFKTDTVSTFLSDSELDAHTVSFQNMGVVSGDDLLTLSLELRNPAIRVKVKDALGLEGPAWKNLRARFWDFARPVIWELDD